MTTLEQTLAKLKLKELELVHKVSSEEMRNGSVVRCILNSSTQSFVAVNGDWENVFGYSEIETLGKSWEELLCPKCDTNKSLTQIIDSSNEDENGFDEYILNHVNKYGQLVSVQWKTKLFTDISALVSIGTVK